MKKTHIGIFSIVVCALSPMLSDGFSELCRNQPKAWNWTAGAFTRSNSKLLADCVIDREFVAEKGIFPPEEPGSKVPPPSQNKDDQTEKPLPPPEEPNDSTPAPGPDLRTQQDVRKEGDDS